MFRFLNNYFIKYHLKRLINLAIKLIYSEQFEMEILLNRLKSEKDIKGLLYAYISIHIASKISKPLSSNDISYAVKEALSSMEYVKDKVEFEKILALHKEIAEISLLERTVAILENKLAFNNDEYSFEGMLYRIESIKKGPASKTEKEKFIKLSDEVNEAETNYNNYINDKASLEGAKKVFERIKSEIAEESENSPPKSKEDLDGEYKELLKQFEKTINKTNSK